MLKTNKKGFTIIEVVLVLAIGGLIFLMVFIALPALQRSQRDSQRRQDVGKVISQIQSYQTNNRGRVPANAAALNASTFKTNYLGGDSEFADPKTGSYAFVSGTPVEGQIQYVVGYKCNGENLSAPNQGGRVVALRIKLEGAGYYCQDNQ